MIVTLSASSDYLKRLTELATANSQGMIQSELDAASQSAEDDVLTALAAEGFSVSGFTTTSNTPYAVIEVIKQLASARVWARALLLYENKKPFSETFGAALLSMANKELDKIIERGMLRAQDGTIIKPTTTQSGKGCPKFSHQTTGPTPTPFAAPDLMQKDFVERHGNMPYQPDPFLQIRR